jgi:hypothetical protein
MTLASAAIPEAAAFVDHSRTIGPRVAAVDASMFGHDAESFDVKSAQKPCNAALLEPLVEASADAALLGDAASLGDATGPTDGAAALGDDVPEQAARLMTEPTIRLRMVRLADM